MNNFKPRDVTICRAANNYIAWRVTLYLWPSFHFCPTKQKYGLIPWLFINQSDWTEQSAIWSEIIHVISKLNNWLVTSREALKSDRMLCFFTHQKLSRWLEKRRNLGQKMVQFLHNSHWWEPIRLQGSSMISKWM